MQQITNFDMIGGVAWSNGQCRSLLLQGLVAHIPEILYFFVVVTATKYFAGDHSQKSRPCPPLENGILKKAGGAKGDGEISRQKWNGYGKMKMVCFKGD